MDFLNAIILLFNYTVLPALTYGSQLALGAIFVTLIYGILRFANFATGDMMSFGTMFSVILTYYLQSIGISFGIFAPGSEAVTLITECISVLNSFVRSATNKYS